MREALSWGALVVVLSASACSPSTASNGDGGLGDASPAPEDGAPNDGGAIADGPAGDTDGAAVLAKLPNAAPGGGIAVDANNVYVTTSSSVLQVPLDGGEPIVLASGGLTASAPFPLAVDAKGVYWGNAGTGFGQDRNVDRVPIGGGPLTTLASDSQTMDPYDVAVDSTSVYWVNGGYGTLTKLPLDGGTPTTLVSHARNSLTSIAVGPSRVYWTELVSSSQTFVVGSCDLDGGAPTTIAQAASGPMQFRVLAVDAAYAYWAGPVCTGGSCGTGVTRAPLSGGAVTPIASAAGAAYGLSLAIDTDSVYWTMQAACEDGGCGAERGAVMRAPIAGGAAVVFARAGMPFGVAVDAANVYWVDFACPAGTGACVMKQAK